ncbi:hypothetical protein SAMN02746041_00404 [Desulfacinum hydrothermale DSM 13146]|uniref:Uncharacterized protein n=1 Tax=Desulfacinum hydrothermale DSM 13146 TaxID=1121390 RepID=A0A1W1X344_9BACT|nr:hypothetical protein SAMN02746041_00404 [Desulfacinum hydrothermale DSM 13146]
MQDLIYMAGRLIRAGRQWFICFGRLNPFVDLWEKLERCLRAGPAAG